MESRDRSRSKGALFELLSLKMIPEGSRGALGGLLGRLWNPPGRSWAALGALLGALGLQNFQYFFKNDRKNSKFVVLEALGLLGVPRAIRARFLTLRGSILIL